MRRGLVVAGVLLAGRLAAADDWSTATRVSGGAEVAGWLWPAAARCTDRDPHLRRQCEVVRTAELARTRDALLVVPGDAMALAIGPWDARGKSVTLSLRGCVACETPVDLAGRPVKIVTRGPAIIAKVERPFADADLADEWREGAARRLRVELLIRIPRAPLAVPGGRAVELVAFRVWDPCDGALLLGSEGARAGAIEAGACKVELRSGAVAGLAVGVRDRLSPDDIKDGLDPVRQPIQLCAYRFGSVGGGKVAMEISGDGVPKKAELQGEFAGTPTGECVVKAVLAARFRPFRRSQVTIVFPFQFSR